jgi:hypothetical protein
MSLMLKQTLAIFKHIAPKKFPIFHMPSYLLDMMCVIHTYSGMIWAWHPNDTPIHI